MKTLVFPQPDKKIVGKNVDVKIGMDVRMDVKICNYS